MDLQPKAIRHGTGGGGGGGGDGGGGGNGGGGRGDGGEIGYGLGGGEGLGEGGGGEGGNGGEGGGGGPGGEGGLKQPLALPQSALRSYEARIQEQLACPQQNSMRVFRRAFDMRAHHSIAPHVNSLHQFAHAGSAAEAAASGHMVSEHESHSLAMHVSCVHQLAHPAGASFSA